MAFKVTIQIPVKAHDGAIWMFQKQDVTMQLQPEPGMLLTGRGIPQIPAFIEVGWASMIREVGEDLDSGIIYVNLHGFTEGTYTKEELLKDRFGPGWVCSPEPLISALAVAEREKQHKEKDDQEGYDDGFPPSDWS